LFRADGGQTDRDIEKGMIANHVVDNCRINESHWKCTKSLNTCSSAVTDSDSNNQSSSDDDDDEEDHASNDDYDEHNVTNEKSMQEIDGIHECWPDEDGNTAMQCLICFESYVDGDELVRHCSSKKSFHRSCIIVWLLRNDNCPYCRSPILNLSTPSGIDEQ
jgi:Ring finger domain